MEIYRFMIAEVPEATNWAAGTVQSVARHRELIRQAALNSVIREISNVAGLYEKANRPPELEQLRTAVESLHKKRSNPQSAIEVLAALDKLKKVPVTGSKFISFHDIYEKYREDGELNDLVDRLVQILEKIIEEDDGSLSSKVEKDIQRLLDQIRNRPKLSTYEIGAWSELTGRFLLELIDHQGDASTLPKLVDGIKLAKEIFDNVFEKYQQSQTEYVRSIGLKAAPIEFTSLPPLSDETIKAAEMKLAELGILEGLPYNEEPQD